MPNTGNKIILTLKRIQNPGGIATGETKDNVLGDAHYLAPVQDLEKCPIAYTLDCPDVRYTNSGNALRFEFNLTNATAANPVLKSIRVKLTGGTNPVQTFTLPNAPSPNYFAGVFSDLDAGVSYTLSVEYLDASSAVLKTCATA